MSRIETTSITILSRKIEFEEIIQITIFAKKILKI